MGCRPTARSVLPCHCVLALRHRSDKPIDILNIGNRLKMAQAFSRYMLSVPNLIWLWRTARCFVACSPTSANFSNPQFGIGIDVVPCFFSMVSAFLSNWGPLRIGALDQRRLFNDVLVIGELVLIKNLSKIICGAFHFPSDPSVFWQRPFHQLGRVRPNRIPFKPMFNINSTRTLRKTQPEDPLFCSRPDPHFSGHQAALLSSCPTIRRAART